jgi:hypothetical protein
MSLMVLALGGILLRRLNLIFLFVIIGGIFALTSCAKSDEKQVLDAIRQYVKYTNDEDAGEVYMLAHRDVRSIEYKNQLDTQYALYDIETKLEKLEFVKIENEIAYVSYTATMIKKDQSDFKNMRIKGTFALKKEDDVWKILGMAYDPEKDIEYLTP